MMKPHAGQALPREVGILLMPGFSMLAFFALVEPMRLANQLLRRCHYQWTLFSSDGAPARASCGMSVASVACPATDVAPQCVFVVAGFDPWPQNDRRLKSWLRDLDRRGALLGAVDTGAFLLASAGLLNGMATALHWESAAAFAELFPDVPVSDRLFELHPRRWLCSGAIAAIDMTLDLIEREHGSVLCDGIATRLVHSRRREQPVAEKPPAPRSCQDADLIRALRIMEAHVEEPIRIVAVANQAELSQRSLERKCRLFLGCTPNQAYLDVRLERARSILRHSDLQVRDVAFSCGFNSVPYFCRAYKARYLIPPGADRRLDEALVSNSRTSADPGKSSADLGNQA